MRKLALATLLLAPPAAAQEINIDFGPPGGPFGAPPTDFGAAGKAGVWNEIDGPATDLLDTAGNSTGVVLTMTGTGQMTALSCNHSGTQGPSELMLDDRLELTGPGHGPTRFYFNGLAPGEYRVRVYAINSCGGHDSVWVGWHPFAFDWLSTSWSGAYEQGANYSHVFGTVGADGELNVSVEGNSYNPIVISGLQIEPSDTVVSYCYGDATAAPCFCSNPGAPGHGCANSTGSGVLLGTSGDTSVATDTLGFHATGLPPGQPALLFVGTELWQGGLGVPFGDGLVCVGGDVIRLEVDFASASGSASWGPGLGALGGWAAGDSRRFQVWYRDPGGPCGTGYNLSQGIETYFTP